MSNFKRHIVMACAAVLMLLSATQAYCIKPPQKIADEGLLGNSIGNKSTRDSLIAKYRSGKLSYSERVKLILDIYDLSVSDPARFSAAKEMFNLAKSKNDIPLQLAAMRYLENNYQEQSAMVPYFDYCRKLAPSNNQKETFQYLRYGIAVQGINRYDDKAAAKILHVLIKEYSERKKSDIYSRTGDLLILCKFLSKSSAGKLYADYLKTLGKLIEKLPDDGRAVLPGTYYSMAISFYIDQDMLEDAYAVNNAMLSYYDGLEREYKAQGRKYISFDTYRYIHYRRELSMSRILSKNQIELDYSKMKELADKNKEIYYDFSSASSPAKINYYMAVKDYAKAIPFLDAALDSNADSLKWMLSDCLKNRIIAGNAIKDNNMDKYLFMYIGRLEVELSSDIEGKTKELQTMYDLNSFKQKSTYRNLTIASAVFFFLLALFFIMLKLLNSSRKMEVSLKKSSVQLEEEKRILSEAMDKIRDAKEQAESANNLKTRFLKNMKQDIRKPLDSIVKFSQLLIAERGTMDEKEAARYVDEIVNNGRLLLKIVGDVLESARKNANEIK
ncbi:MAG: hypothetical protein LKM37_08135 [Bacteroidales bacterium]|jgi:hypothetical protein|nr:hypothetical protein [Bacteroidales bacterium]MCI1733688.1 hypothetical protein [Bacteroidales bacterium]